MTDPDLSDLADYQAKDPQQALDAALAAVRAYCGWHIVPSISETVNVWSPGGQRLFLQTRNLTAVISVIQDGATVSASTYTFERRGVIRRTSGCFSLRTPAAANITHGYAELPADVKDVVLALAEQSISDTRGLASKSVGPFSENYSPELDQSQKDKLAPYTTSTGFA